MEGHKSLVVRQSTSLPEPRTGDGQSVARGFAVTHQGWAHSGQWLFFHHLEPAWAYGRAAAMSPHTASWSIRQAALVILENAPGAGNTALHLGPLVPWNVEGDFDANTLQRWVEGTCDPRGWAPVR